MCDEVGDDLAQVRTLLAEAGAPFAPPVQEPPVIPWPPVTPGRADYDDPAAVIRGYIVEMASGRLAGAAGWLRALTFHCGEPVVEIKRTWTTPAMRGHGLGRRLLSELERQASAHGAGILRPETNHGLAEAIRLDRSSGFAEVEPFNDELHTHHWFEKRIT